LRHRSSIRQGISSHRPEATLLYELVERHYPELVAAREAAGRPLPKYVRSRTGEPPRLGS
jgi:hypothetical protein